MGRGITVPCLCFWSCVSISEPMVFERGFFMFSEDFDDADFGVDDDEVLECGLENPDICESCQ